MPLETCPFLKTVYFESLFSMWLWFLPNEEGTEGGERELIYCPPCFRRVCGRVESGSFEGHLPDFSLSILTTRPSGLHEGETPAKWQTKAPVLF